MRGGHRVEVVRVAQRQHRAREHGALRDDQHGEHDGAEHPQPRRTEAGEQHSDNGAGEAAAPGPAAARRASGRGSRRSCASATARTTTEDTANAEARPATDEHARDPAVSTASRLRSPALGPALPSRRARRDPADASRSMPMPARAAPTNPKTDCARVIELIEKNGSFCSAASSGPPTQTRTTRTTRATARKTRGVRSGAAPRGSGEQHGADREHERAAPRKPTRLDGVRPGRRRSPPTHGPTLSGATVVRNSPSGRCTPTASRSSSPKRPEVARRTAGSGWRPDPTPRTTPAAAGRDTSTTARRVRRRTG